MLPPSAMLRGERAILRGPRESDVDDRLRYPIDPEEEDAYGWSWRREWDGRCYHTREHLTARQGPPDPNVYTWAVEHDGQCIGSAGLRVDPELVAEAAVRCADVSLLVNNAGVMQASTFIDAPSLDAARLEMETNYFGTLRMCRAFAPVLAANGGGAIVNMLSVTSFYTNPLDASYGASKAAAWSLTNGIRIELHHQGTLVVAVHAGFIDTDMAALVDAPKISPESVAQQAFDAVEADQIEVLADERTRFVKASLPRDHELIYPPAR